MAGTRKNGMKWDRGRLIERKKAEARARASVKTHHSVNNAQSESDSKSGEIVRTPPQMRQERTEKSTRRAVVLQIFPRASFYTQRREYTKFRKFRTIGMCTLSSENLIQGAKRSLL